MLCQNTFYIFLTLTLISIDNPAQQVVTDTPATKMVIAGPAYEGSKFYRRFWGHNRRMEWTIPVAVPVFRLDAVYGGLKPYKTGGGNETKSLRLRTDNGKEYVLRSINKSRNDVVPPDFKGTFVEDKIIDAVSMLHPYGALALPVMQQHAGIYHTLPTVVYVPRQAALDTFNNKFADDLYLFEQRPEGDWSEADNLGNFKHFSSTHEVIVKLLEDNSHKINQYAFVKARLFDMLIGDWDRHEDNWSWGWADSSAETEYTPIPRDRDQAFFTHNGMFIDRIMPSAGLDFMQNFGHRVKGVRTINVGAKDIDRFFTNAMTLDDWMHAAKSLQQALTDTVIEQSVRQLPPAVFAVSGKELIEKLKSRREQLIRFATRYYLFLAKEVEVTGTKQPEYFDVSSTASGETVVAVFRIDSLGQKPLTAYYQRIFKPGETKEVRLYGIGGEDVYAIRGHSEAITIRIIGGPGKDSIVQAGQVIHVYDNPENAFHTTSARMHLSSARSVHDWDYEWYRYNVKGFRPSILYSNADRFYVGLSYRVKKYKWRKYPFASQQSVSIRYSLSQNALSASWSAQYPAVIKGWKLSLQAEYDVIRWTNFYGTGNETKMVSKDVDYHRLRSEEWFASAGLQHAFGKSTVSVSTYYQRVKNRNDTGRYVSKVFYAIEPEVYKPNQYGGLQLMYTYVSVNDSIVPVKGFSFFASGTLSNNFTQQKVFQRYDTRLQAYFPFSKHLSLAVRVGGATIVNKGVLNSGQIYQHAVIGGPRSLRGYRIERFWGRTSFYNTNELRYITNLRTHLLTGRVGLIGFFDDGRVWMPDENSGKLHTSYGAGVLFAPFNKLCVTVTYGISEEIRLVQLRLDTLF